MLGLSERSSLCLPRHYPLTLVVLEKLRTALQGGWGQPPSVGTNKIKWVQIRRHHPCFILMTPQRVFCLNRDCTNYTETLLCPSRVPLVQSPSHSSGQQEAALGDISPVTAWMKGAQMLPDSLAAYAKCFVAGETESRGLFTASSTALLFLVAY